MGEQLRRGADDGVMAMHPGQLHPDVDTVRRLISAQFPSWRGLDIREYACTGTVYAIFRIGAGLAARLPLTPGEPLLVRERLANEARAMRAFARSCTVPPPRPIAIGAPGVGYPSPWSIQTWIPGADATVEDPRASTGFAQDLAILISRLRAHGTGGRRFEGEGRGGHLPDHDDWLEFCFGQSEDLVDVARLRRIWSTVRELPEVDPDAMCHADLTPTNVLVRDGRLTGVLDAGDFGPADPALDLVAAWHLLDAERADQLRAVLGCDEVQWLRGMAWALQQSMGVVWYYRESNPTMSRWGTRTLDRILAAWPS